MDRTLLQFYVENFGAHEIVWKHSESSDCILLHPINSYAYNLYFDFVHIKMHIDHLLEQKET